MLLEIKNLTVKLCDKTLLDNISMSVASGTRHFIGGNNGSGKSTLAGVISGNPDYTIVSGKIIFDGRDITNENTTTRALLGIFLGAQMVPEIPGLSLTSFLKHGMAAHSHFETGRELSMGQFLTDLDAACEKLNIPSSWLNRSINVGFSGGERKKIMLLRLLLTKPKLAILDEPDSGADAIVQKQTADIINEMTDTTFLIISHQEAFHKLVLSDKTTTLSAGKIVI